MKKTLIILSVVCSIFLLNPKSTFAAFVEFNPKTAQFVSPNQNKKDISPKPVAKPAVQGFPVYSESYIKNLVTNAINDMVAQGLLKGQKGDKGDSATVANLGSYDPEATGLQQVYLPGAILAPDVGTFFSATNLSSDNINSSSATLGDTTVENGTITSLHVGSLSSDSGAYLSDGGDWVNASSKELKDNFIAVSPEDILAKIDALPIYSWNYKTQDASVSHIGPLAEDFHQAFELGGKDGDKAISTIDPAGVALAGIQGINKQLKQLLDFSWVINGLKDFGVEVQKGLVKIRELAADLITTKNLEVGSSEQPAGITIYDRATGQPVCVYSENSILKSESGKCQAGLISESAAPIEDPSLNQNLSSESADNPVEDVTLSNP